MNILSAFIHNMKRTVRGYIFQGNWTEGERATIVAALTPHVQETESGGFNTWIMECVGEYYSARRFTWRMGAFSGTSARDVAEQIEEYYSRYSLEAPAG